MMVSQHLTERTVDFTMPRETMRGRQVLSHRFGAYGARSLCRSEAVRISTTSSTARNAGPHGRIA